MKRRGEGRGNVFEEKRQAELELREVCKKNKFHKYSIYYFIRLAKKT